MISGWRVIMQIRKNIYTYTSQSSFVQSKKAISIHHDKNRIKINRTCIWSYSSKKLETSSWRWKIHDSKWKQRRYIFRSYLWPPHMIMIFVKLPSDFPQRVSVYNPNERNYAAYALNLCARRFYFRFLHFVLPRRLREEFWRVSDFFDDLKMQNRNFISEMQFNSIN